jgi:hypothetical protein
MARAHGSGQDEYAFGHVYVPCHDGNEPISISKRFLGVGGRPISFNSPCIAFSPSSEKAKREKPRILREWRIVP